MTKQITGELKAYVNTKYSSIDAASLHSLADAPQEARNKLISALVLTGGKWADENDEYLRVGTATVTLNVIGRDDMVKGQIDTLEAAKKRVIAEAQAEVSRIEDRISKLLAIPFEG